MLDAQPHGAHYGIVQYSHDDGIARMDAATVAACRIQRAHRIQVAGRRSPRAHLRRRHAYTASMTALASSPSRRWS